MARNSSSHREQLVGTFDLEAILHGLLEAFPLARQPEGALMAQHVRSVYDSTFRRSRSELYVRTKVSFAAASHVTAVCGVPMQRSRVRLRPQRLAQPSRGAAVPCSSVAALLTVEEPVPVRRSPAAIFPAVVTGGRVQKHICTLYETWQYSTKLGSIPSNMASVFQSRRLQLQRLIGSAGSIVDAKADKEARIPQWFPCSA